MNLPNQLTVGRFVLTALFLIVFFSRVRYADTIALAIFVAASITDYYDGEIARKRKLITNFGILMDPLADKILTCSAFIAFVESNDMAAWMCVVIVARELGITGLRMLAASKSKVLAAERYGKHKTISQMVAIISVLMMKSFPEWGEAVGPLFSPWLPKIAMIAIWVSVALTAFSGALYLWRNREIYLSDV
jgi:CDP-diacylglycerol---glycerol-3-phosphate 3-phosphatidyltransferase